MRLAKSFRGFPMPPEEIRQLTDESTKPVRFRLRDARLPPANELLALLWGDQVLEGHVVAQSRAEGDELCVVVKDSGVDQLVVVSKTNLLAGR
jgi:hypothetical protein